MTSSAPRILDPHAIPVMGTDAHLPPVPADRLQPEALRRRFANPPIWTGAIPGDGQRFNPHGVPVAASVLIPLVMRANGLQVLLTQRTAHLRDHAGQICLPGGRSELDDVDAVATALRETEEEVGLDRSYIEIIGTLPVYHTVTSYAVTPVVALVEPNFTLTLDAFEVDQAFEVPLDFLMTPANHRRHSIVLAGQQRQFLSMPWVPPQNQPSAQTPTQPNPQPGSEPFFIWGATAAMLRNLYHFLALA
jgi:8-oxo-dGTP pyrophosphatase MutT (NUDIX family)